MFIVDSNNYRVLRWNSGDPLGYVVAGGNGNGAAFNQIGTSYALFVDSQYNIYISDNSNNRITKWSQTNTSSGVLVIFNVCFFFNLNYFNLRLLVEMVLEVHQIN
jgi:hypothetical protein